MTNPPDGQMTFELQRIPDGEGACDECKSWAAQLFRLGFDSESGESCEFTHQGRPMRVCSSCQKTFPRTLMQEKAPYSIIPLPLKDFPLDILGRADKMSP